MFGGKFQPEGLAAVSAVEDVIAAGDAVGDTLDLFGGESEVALVQLSSRVASGGGVGEKEDGGEVVANGTDDALVER